ncbi:MAG TPA: response regulator [Candidatus Saccharimonadales bacterium]|nr:response regulator [Candidatus Saccharimonadales bacterium]
MAKILLVEDDNNLREIYEARLQAEGYTIVSAQDGEEALVVAKAEKPDLVISDVMMPKISGFEMLDILRNTEGLQHVKVIMLTALGQSDDQQRATKLGADRYLVKSQVTLEDIVKTAHDLLADEAASEPTVPGATSEPTPVTPAPAAPVAPAAPAPTTAPPVPPAEAPSAPTPPPAVPVATPLSQTAPATPPPATPPSPAPSAPTPPAPVAAAPASEPAAAPETEKKSAADNNKAADDKLMDDAVNALIAETEKQKQEEAAGGTDKGEEEAKPEDASDKKADEEKPKIKTESSALNKPSDIKSEDEEGPSGGEAPTEQVPIAHKKVIKPLEGEPKKDINELLALEEAKEAGTTAPPITSDATPPPEPAPAETAKDEKGSEAAAEEALEAAKSAVAASSASQEEANVEAKIEDFVAGASTEPSQPTPAPKIAVETPDDSNQPAPAAAPAPVADTSATSDTTSTPAPAATEPAPAPVEAAAEKQPETPADDAKNSPDPNTIAL